MQNLDPRSIVWFFLRSFVGGLLFVLFFVLPTLVALMSAVMSFKVLIIIIPLAVIVLIGLLYLMAFLTFKFYHYELRDESFRKELGVIYKQYVSIPYDRIQNVDIHRGLFERMLGLSHLNIQTAGTGMGGRFGAEGNLPGLDKDVAERLRDELITRAQKAKNQGL